VALAVDGVARDADLSGLGSNALRWITRLDAAVSKLTTDVNLAQVLKQLRGSGDLAFSSWRWITGQKLASKELQEIKVTRNLSEVGVGDQVIMLQVLGNLARAVGHTLIFCVDEMKSCEM